jgi:hypothetical protein
MSELYVPDPMILLTKQVERFATKLTDDKDQQREILDLWNDTIGKSKDTNNIVNDEKKNDPPIVDKASSIKTKNLIEKAGIIAVKTLSGYMVDPTTKLAFDKNRLVIGKEVKGKIEPLTTDDISFCEKQMIEIRSRV